MALRSFPALILMAPGHSTESGFLPCSPRWCGVARRGGGVWWEPWGSHHRFKLPLVESVPDTGQGWRLLGVPQLRPDLQRRNGRKPVTLRW